MKAHLADRLLRDHALWWRAALPLNLAALGLAATLAVLFWQHPSLGKVQSWSFLPAWWSIGLGLTLVTTLVAWLIRRQNLAHSAQKLDQRLAAKNRLETATERLDDGSALARAQREETASFLKSVAAAHPRRAPFVVLLSLVALLALVHIALLTAWTRPWVAPVAPPAKPEPKPPAPPAASIQWKSPEAETKATSVEEVPLKATANSTSGLRDAVIEIAVNGEPRQSVPLGLEELKAAGSHNIQTSLFLDQLEVEPFDVVSYYIRAQRIDAHPLPETTSPVQFVQIRPFRDDVQEVPGGDAFSLFPLIKALKVAQLRLMKENFLLAHTDLDHASSPWKKENERVGHEQALLEQKAGDAIEKLTTEGLPPRSSICSRKPNPRWVLLLERSRPPKTNPPFLTKGNRSR